jgi:hypothetical protein
MSDTEETKIDSTNDTGASDSGADHAVDRHDHSDQERSASVRDAIKSAWAEQTGEEPEDSREASREERRKRDERKEWERPGRAAREAKSAAAEHAAARDPNKAGAADTAGQYGQQQAADINTPPPAFSKEAKAAWANTPEAVRRAALKREEDVRIGVDSLKKSYAEMERNYSEIDRALSPHRNVIRSFGHSDAQSISQMFAWFDALSKRPDESFPVLLRSFNYDPRRLIQNMGYTGGQQQQAQAQQAGGGQIDPQLYNYLSTVEQRLGAQQQMNEAHQMAQTHAILDEFAKSHPHFEKVRRRMGELLNPNPQTGQSIIPLAPEGHVDLQTAYDMACNLDDSIRESMFQERIANERRAAKEAADKARRASAGLRPGAPGGNNTFGSGANKQKQRQSVRESIEAAVAESRGGSRI